MQNSKIFPGKMPRTPVLGDRKFCFRSPIMYQNSPTAMQIPQIFPGTKPWTPFQGLGKFVSVLHKFTKTLLYSNAEFENFPGHKTPDLRFRGRKVCFHSPKIHKISPIQQCRIHKFSGDNTPETRFTGEESLFSFSENVPKLSYSNAEFKKKYIQR